MRSSRLQGSFIVFASIYYLTTMIGIVLAYAFASACSTMDAANALLPTYITICMYFGGLFLLFDKIPIGWQWFSYTTFLRYAWCALMVNQFDNAEFNSKTDFNNMNVLTFYGMEEGFENSIGLSAGILGLMIFLFAIMGVYALETCQHATR